MSVVWVFVPDIADETVASFIPSLEMPARKQHEIMRQVWLNDLDIIFCNISHALVFDPGEHSQ